jgi:hypothetical protein
VLALLAKVKFLLYSMCSQSPIQTTVLAQLAKEKL